MDYYGGPQSGGLNGTPGAPAQDEDIYMRVGGPPASLGAPPEVSVQLRGPRSSAALRQQLLREVMGPPATTAAAAAAAGERHEGAPTTEAERQWRVWLSRQASILGALVNYLRTHASPQDHPAAAPAGRQQQHQQQQQHLQKVASSVPVYLDASDLLEQQPLLAKQLLLLPQHTLQLLNQRVLPALCMRLLQLQQQQQELQQQQQQQQLEDAEQQQQQLQQLHLLQQAALQAAPPLRVRLTHVPRDELTSKTSAE
ncbi:hypothetical protein ACSSS7_002461 [Eimeria intestinalis]